jgi:hypothetical protein
VSYLISFHICEQIYSQKLGPIFCKKEKWYTVVTILTLHVIFLISKDLCLIYLNFRTSCLCFSNHSVKDLGTLLKNELQEKNRGDDQSGYNTSIHGNVTMKLSVYLS